MNALPTDTYAKDATPSSPENAFAKSEHTGGLDSLFKVSVGARVMLRHNLDVSDGLCNGPTGTAAHISRVSGEVSGEENEIWGGSVRQGGQRWRDARQSVDTVGIRMTARFYGRDALHVQRQQFPRLRVADEVFSSILRPGRRLAFYDGGDNLGMNRMTSELCCVHREQGWRHVHLRRALSRLLGEDPDGLTRAVAVTLAKACLGDMRGKLYNFQEMMPESHIGDYMRAVSKCWRQQTHLGNSRLLGEVGYNHARRRRLEFNNRFASTCVFRLRPHGQSH
eukprot:5592793-Amphidinium_carterae.1